MPVRYLLAVAFVLGTAGVGLAHGVGMDPRVAGGRVIVEAYFDDDTPARDAKMTAVDAAGGLIAEGRTDETGVWSFPEPPPGTYTLTLDDGTGHRCQRTLTIAPAAAATTDGPDRQAVTGSGKWRAAVGGLLLIAGLTVAARRASRRRG